MIAYIWPDGVWCWAYELTGMLHKSDDYLIYECDESSTDDDVAWVADYVQRKGQLP